MAEDREGRELRIVTRRGAAGPVVVAVTLVASACGSNVSVGTSGAGAGGAAGGMGGAPATSSSSGGTGGVPFVGGSGPGAGGEVPCSNGGVPETFTVSVPPEGTPAEAGQICSVMMGPVESNTAARVTLTKDPQALHLATGEVVVEPGLLADVVGIPIIEAIGSPLQELLQMTVSNVTPTATGFAFEASWPPPLAVGPSAESVVLVRTTFDLACPPNQTKQVEAITHVNLCGEGPDDLEWISSGDECTICGIIAEMAPSPIVPDAGGDEIGLGRVIQLRLVTVARVGASLVLLAEHDGGEGLDYEWIASAGEIVRVAPDLVLWTPPEGEEAVLQVAVECDDAAAVASFTDVPVRAAGLVA